MGVYIPDMKLPSSCLTCDIPVRVQPCPVDHDNVSNYKTSRHPACPLIPVPPHGRLIDANARADVQLYNDELEDFQTVNMSIDDLLDSSWIELEDDPTIIPAEEGKE